MFNKRRSSALFAAALAGALVLTACSDDSSDSDDVATVTATSTTTTAADPAPTDSADSTAAKSCPGLSGQDAYNKWISEVPVYDFGSGTGITHEWDRVNEQDNYSSDVALSWMVVGFYDATTSSPYHIMLFHQGCYIGTATSEAFGFYPDVTRTGDDSIAVTYHFAQPGESDAEHSGTANATFTWNEETQSVDMTGEVPGGSTADESSDSTGTDDTATAAGAGSCDVAAIISQTGLNLDPTAMTTVYCDGSYAMYGPPNTGTVMFAHNDGTGWAAFQPHGHNNHGAGDGACLYPDRAAAEGVPEEITSMMQTCDA